MKTIARVILLLLSAIPALAQQKITMLQATEMALQNNITIKQAEFSQAVSSIDLLESKMALYPDLNANASENFNFGRSIDPLTNQFVNERVNSNNFSLSSNVLLFGGLQRIQTISRNKLLLEASKSGLQKTKNEILLSVVNFYLQALYFEDLLTAANARKSVSAEEYDRALKREKVGNITLGDVLNVKAQLAAEELNVITAQNNLDIAMINLTQLIDRDMSKKYSLERVENLEVADEQIEKNVSVLYGEAVKVYPEVVQAEYNTQASIKAIQIAKGGYYPRLSLGASIGTGYSSGRGSFSFLPRGFGEQYVGSTRANDSVFIAQAIVEQQFLKTDYFDQLNDNVNQSIGFNLSIPIFNNWNTRLNVRRTKINQQSSALNEELIKNNLNKLITQSVADINAAEKKYVSAGDAFRSLSESFKYNQQKFDVGLLSSVDFNTVKSNLSRTEADFIQSKYDLIFKRKILDFYLGKPLNLN